MEKWESGGEDPEMPLTLELIYGRGTKSGKAMLVTLMIGLRWQMMIGSGGICRYENCLYGISFGRLSSTA